MGKRLTTEDVIKRAIDKHNNTYDYSNVKYVNPQTSVEIICKEHGSWMTNIHSHINGARCPKCVFKNKTFTTEKFVEKAISTHGNFYDYSKVKYVNSKTKVEIICPHHGSFLADPNHHIRGSICMKCSIENSKLTMNEFLERAVNLHGDKYDYSLVKFNSTNDKIDVICPHHGKFSIRLANHLHKAGCWDCAGSKKLTTEEYIEKAKKKHGDKYDYSEVKYINTASKVTIICPKHGSFLQRPSTHLKKGCYECGLDNNRLTIDEFLVKAKTIHGDKYDYSLVKFDSVNDKINIKCNCCNNNFIQRVSAHLDSQGCRKCAIKEKTKTKEKFIEEATAYHNGRYDYSFVNYTNQNEVVEIICPIHKSFFQKPKIHLKCGCPKCNSSKGEKAVRDFLDEKKIEFIPQMRFENCVHINELVFDFYLPKHNILIEYDGKQHFKPIKHFGGIDGFNIRKKRDEIKNNYCRDNNIKLLRIRYDQDIIEILDKELNG